MSNENSQLKYESGVTPYPMEALTDSGDKKTFNSQAALFSESIGNSPIIKPNGVLTGGVITPAVSGTDNLIDVAALSLNLNGVETSVSASLDLSMTRPATAVAKVLSIQVNAAGTIVVVAGTDSVDANVIETRGVGAGQIPYILTDSVEIGQIRLSSNTVAAILVSEVFQVVGTHLEKADFPTYEADNFTATVAFNSTLPASHTGDIVKAVHASYADPVFTEQNFANDFVPSENSHSVSSEQVYGATVGTSSSSLGQGSFTAILKDGITDALVSLKNQNLFFKYFQDKFKAPHIITQGKLGLSRTFGASDNPKVSATISSSVESIEKAS